jgi:hypothetical protein
MQRSAVRTRVISRDGRRRSTCFWAIGEPAANRLSGRADWRHCNAELRPGLYGTLRRAATAAVSFAMRDKRSSSDRRRSCRSGCGGAVILRPERVRRVTGLGHPQPRARAGWCDWSFVGGGAGACWMRARAS